jgi:hypothetical protein
MKSLDAGFFFFFATFPLPFAQFILQGYTICIHNSSPWKALLLDHFLLQDMCCYYQTPPLHNINYARQEAQMLCFVISTLWSLNSSKEYLKNSVCTSKRTQPVIIATIKWLMLFKEKTLPAETVIQNP